jgi:hypothetical protein
MMSPISCLVWKEWREWRWPLAIGAAWMTLGVVYVLVYELYHGSATPVASWFDHYLLFVIVGPILVAMKTSLGEVKEGTLPFSSSLPVSLGRQACVRLGASILTLVLPIALGSLMISVLVFREMNGPLFKGSVEQVLTLTAIATASTVEFLLILSLIGTRLRAQSHLGFIAAIVALLWAIPLPYSMSLSEPVLLSRAIVPHSFLVGYVGGATNFSDISLARRVWAPLALNLLLLIALGWCFVCCYGRRGVEVVWSSKIRMSWRLPAILSRLPIRWPGRLTALLWLDLRQAVPLCLAGLGFACLLTAWVILFGQGYYSDLLQRVAGQLPGSTWIVAVIWGAVVGSGVFASELEPRLEQFWRSRPISPSAWFWVKFLGGLAAVLGVLDLVTVLVGWGSPYSDNPTKIDVAYIACMPMLHALVYALAVLGTCWLRRPVLAAMLAVFAFFIVSMAFAFTPQVAELDPTAVFMALESESIYGPLDLSRHGYPEVYRTIAFLFVVTTLAAWKATCGRRQSRERQRAGRDGFGVSSAH